MKLIGGWRGWNVEVSQEKEEAIKKANEGRKRERNEGRQERKEKKNVIMRRDEKKKEKTIGGKLQRRKGCQVSK